MAKQTSESVAQQVADGICAAFPDAASTDLGGIHSSVTPYDGGPDIHVTAQDRDDPVIYEGSAEVLSEGETAVALLLQSDWRNNIQDAVTLTGTVDEVVARGVEWTKQQAENMRECESA